MVVSMILLAIMIVIVGVCGIISLIVFNARLNHWFHLHLQEKGKHEEVLEKAF